MSLVILEAADARSFSQFGSLVREYMASLSFSLDFQDTDRELASLEHEYGPPSGVALLAVEGDRALGCVGVRRLEGEVAELKRMYVSPEARGRGIGRGLCEAALAAARRLGYASIRLDTVAEMTAAARVYEAAGFHAIPAYRENPLPTARFYERSLSEGVAAPAGLSEGPA